MGLMAAQFHWPASQYWDSTMHEIMATIEAWEELNAPPDP